MHPSARAHMRLSIELYLRKDRHYRVLDFGSRNQHEGRPTHRDLLTDYDCTITGVDVEPGPNVDLTMAKPYRLPVKSNSVDVIITGQAFEHIPFFWVSFLELCRVLAPGGLILLTAPSRGHVHFSMDSWRYYPDSMRSLAAFSRMTLREAHTDLPPTLAGSARLDYAAIDAQDRYWGDTVGVFQKPKRYSRRVALTREVLVWWANRVGGIDGVPRPAPRRKRTKLAAADLGRPQR